MRSSAGSGLFAQTPGPRSRRAKDCGSSCLVRNDGCSGPTSLGGQTQSMIVEHLCCELYCRRHLSVACESSTASAGSNIDVIRAGYVVRYCNAISRLPSSFTHFRVGGQEHDLQPERDDVRRKNSTRCTCQPSHGSITKYTTNSPNHNPKNTFDGPVFGEPESVFAERCAQQSQYHLSNQPLP